ncbi:hypothetical protein [Croceicoccus naphthovorans]|uniref:Uncharacterized protein n=1 Tax=Croceicoccus naphthovorans TaxID=1348774 RepID=A0A0G3XGC6_9SPHN|nr:hypothetical protein [Croceicoccus naphthovorans]AKM09664.1 hypothetical protein AB433_06185 [Croceicoccus naphthovorans]MBB3990785.1 hypothetical protein [Croceicoccus naphthovorans]
MKKMIAASLAAGLVSVAAPALADHHEEMKAEVVERNEKGHAIKVKVGDTVYPVCTPESQDGCINPREAGLNFGNAPLDHWPGAPASGLTPAEKMRTAEQNAAIAAEAEAEAPAE